MVLWLFELIVIQNFIMLPMKYLYYDSAFHNKYTGLLSILIDNIY